MLQCSRYESWNTGVCLHGNSHTIIFWFRRMDLTFHDWLRLQIQSFLMCIFIIAPVSEFGLTTTKLLWDKDKVKLHYVRTAFFSSYPLFSVLLFWAWKSITSGTSPPQFSFLTTLRVQSARAAWCTRWGCRQSTRRKQPMREEQIYGPPIRWPQASCNYAAFTSQEETGEWSVFNSFHETFLKSS